MLTGHPKGLYRLFFIEMWERLAFYTMVGVLLLYTIAPVSDSKDGGLGLTRILGNEIYGLYLAFVYFTPYLGGLIADRFLGYRRAVLIGAVFFATGFVLMSLRDPTTFYVGLVCLCIGNGFFKPNISVMVGNLYQAGDPKRDAGFNIFYMGINIGAFFANFLAASMRNWEGWRAVFLAAAVGMVIGMVILLASWKVLERADRRSERGANDTTFAEIFAKILVPAFVVGIAGYFLAKQYLPEGSSMRPAVVGFLAGMIPIMFFFVRLGTKADDEEKPGLLALLPVYVAGGTFFMVLHLNGSAMTAWALDKTDRVVSLMPSRFERDALPSYYDNAAPDTPRPNRLNLLAVAQDSVETMFESQRISDEVLAELTAALPADVRVERIPTEEEQQSETQRTWDPRATNVYDEVTIETERDSHGHPLVSAKVPEGATAIERVVLVRTVPEHGDIPVLVVSQQTFDELYAGNPPEKPVGQYLQVANPELFQSLNALFVIGFTPLIVAFFGWLISRGKAFSTARKIFTGLLLTTISLLLMALAGVVGDNGAVKVSYWWLVGFYAIITIGELCLSPMALSLVTKLSPKRFVGLTMGGWFIATAFGNNFSGFFGGLESQMEPMSFFLLLATITGLVTLLIGVLLPKLDRAIRKYGA
ncbi:MAG: MFS transporter [Planctomycetes bacterium]|nr:MFS transporter [Planctomycetota bacterium]